MKNAKEIFGNLEGLDQKSVQFLSKALSRKNLPGFDYLEYRKSINAMREIRLDKETSYKSAFATASTLGLTKEKLVETAVHYRKVLEEEKAQFDQALEKQINERVSAREALREKLMKEKELLKKQIAELEEKIRQIDARAEDTDKEIALSQERIDEAKSKFEETYLRFSTFITDDIQYIKSTL